MARVSNGTAAELTGALMVITNRRLRDDRWLDACAGVLRLLVRATSAAVVIRTPRIARISGAGAAKVLEGPLGRSLREEEPREGVRVESEGGAHSVVADAAPRDLATLTVHPGAGRWITFLLLFGAPLEPPARDSVKAGLEIAEPVLRSEAAVRFGNELPSSLGVVSIGDEDVLSLRERYRLTRREVEVTRLLLRGRSNRQIADSLNISEHTARHHTERVLGKLGVSSRAAISSVLASRSD